MYRAIRIAVALLIATALLLALPSTASASKSSGHSAHAASSKSSSAKHTSTKPRETSPSRAVAVPRDSHGHIKRSEATKAAFNQQTGYTNGRPGYVIDHIKPLACGGPDAPSNMQWQTIEAAKAKDKVERLSCR